MSCNKIWKTTRQSKFAQLHYDWTQDINTNTCSDFCFATY